MIFSSELKNKISNINFWIAILICFLFPIYQKIIPLLIFTWVLTFIVQCNPKDILINILKSKSYILLLAFFCIHLISLIYTKNISSGIFDIESKLSLLFFPLIFPSLPSIYKDKYKSLLDSLIAGCIVASLICLANSSYLVFSLNAPLQYYTYTDLSILMHPTYFAIYICVAIIAIIEKLKNQINTALNVKVYCAIILMFFAFMIFLLSSKAGIVTLFFIILITLIKSIKLNLKSISLSLLAIFISTFILIKNDRFQPLKKIIVDAVTNNPNENKTIESSSERIIIWDCSLTLIKKNWLLGIGAGDVKDVLTEEYKKIGFDIGIIKRLNSHNQYIETFISVGIIGFIILILILFIQISQSIINKDYFSFLFSIIFIINFLFESILNNQAGIVFFTFFYCLSTTFINSKKTPLIAS